MRISDWSSDVCSSDLWRFMIVARTVARRYRTASKSAMIFSAGIMASAMGGMVDARMCHRNPAPPPQCRSAAIHLWKNGSRSEEHTSELQSLMRNSYAVFCLKKKKSDRSIDHQKQNN